MLENDFTLKGNGIVPMTSAGKRRSSSKKKTMNNGWVVGNNNSRKKMGSTIRRTIKPQTLAEMLAYSRPSTQAGKTVKGFFRNNGSNGSSPKVFKFTNGFFRRQVSQGKLQTPAAKPGLSNVKSTVTLKQSQITLSPKYKDYYQSKKRGSTNVIEVESPVDNLTATSGASNTLQKINKQPVVNINKNTQGLQGSIYSNSNSIDVRTKIENKDSQMQNTKEHVAPELVYNPEIGPKRAITQSSKVRLGKGSVNRIREAKEQAKTLVGKDGNNAVFQYQFEMQNKEEEN
jgi:hypothetical protein